MVGGGGGVIGGGGCACLSKYQSVMRLLVCVQVLAVDWQVLSLKGWCFIFLIFMPACLHHSDFSSPLKAAPKTHLFNNYF